MMAVTSICDDEDYDSSCEHLHHHQHHDMTRNAQWGNMRLSQGADMQQRVFGFSKNPLSRYEARAYLAGAVCQAAGSSGSIVGPFA